MLKQIIDGWYNLLVKPADYISEQASFRQLNCPECKALGACTECGCNYPAMTLSPTKVCPKGNWEPMMEESAWNIYRQSTPVSISISLESPILPATNNTFTIPYKDVPKFLNLLKQLDEA